MIVVQTRRGISTDKGRDRLLWIFRTLWDEQQLHLVGLDVLMDEMERTVQNDPRLKELLSPWVTGVISDLSVISECRRQISLYQPWAATFEDAMVKRMDDIKADFGRTVSGWRQFNKSFKGTSLAVLGNPSDGKFFYPVDKRRTRENTEAMRTAEHNLDRFWERVDKFLIEEDGMYLHQAVRDLLDKRILRRTPEWVEPVKDQKPAADIDTPEALCKPLSQLYFELEYRTGRTVGPDKEVPTKTKVKTRGPAQPVQPEKPEEHIATRHQPDHQPAFSVDKRALKVFSTIFYVPSRTAQPGEISWTDFLHAMSSTGFAIEKLYGSVWQFTPSNLDVERSIQFHERHPSGKIPFRTARRHGRRLFRA